MSKKPKAIPQTVLSTSPLLVGGMCLDCGLGFLNANDADKHFKSDAHRYRYIDRVLARKGWLAQCSGRCYFDGGRWWC